jgi:hypothetical protein
MKKKLKAHPFDWSKTPSRDGVYKVFLSDPSVYSKFGKDISREEFINALSKYNRIKELEYNKLFFRNLFFYTLLSFPIMFFVYNVFIKPIV